MINFISIEFLLGILFGFGFAGFMVLLACLEAERVKFICDEIWSKCDD